MSIPEPPLPEPSIGLVALVRRLFEVSFIRFVIVGVSNTALGYAIFWFAHRTLPAFSSQVVSYLLSMLWSYYWNRRWTFKSSSNVTGEAVKFFSSQIAFMFLSASSLGFLVDHLHENASLSWLFTVAVITVLNFVVSRFWSFKTA